MNEPARHYPGAMSAVFITLGGVFAWALVIAFFGPDPDIGAIGIGQAIGLGMVATLAARNVPAPQNERLGLCGFDPRLLPTLLLVLPVVVLSGELDTLLRDFVPAIPALPESAAGEAAPDAQLDTLQSAIVVIGIAPVVEEFLFRGVLLQGIVATLGRMRGVLLTAVLFAMVNVAPTSVGGSPAAILLASLAFGTIYGLARLATGSLLAPILLHVAVNAMGFAAASAVAPGASEEFNAVGHTSVTILLAAAIAVTIGVRGLWQAAGERESTPPLPRDPGAAWRESGEE